MRTTISAIQVTPSEDGSAHSGLFTQLPVDAPMEICGAGWSETMILVRSEGLCYMVFRQDLESSHRRFRTVEDHRNPSPHVHRRVPLR